MPDAARITDDHECPLPGPGPGQPPHKGGHIYQGEGTVIIANQRAARKGDFAASSGAVDFVSDGSPTVLIANQPAARKGDPTAHGGKVTGGCPTVKIGNSGGGASAHGGGAPLLEPCQPQGGQDPNPTI